MCDTGHQGAWDAGCPRGRSERETTQVTRATETPSKSHMIAMRIKMKAIRITIRLVMRATRGIIVITTKASSLVINPSIKKD